LIRAASQCLPAAGDAQVLELDPAKVDLWFTYYEAIRDERLLAQYMRLLTEEERTQQQRFYFEKDRHRYLVTRALVRTILSRYAPVAAPDWVFSKNDHGRPEIANDEPAARTISFNITHTHGLIVLAVTRDQAIGVDAENISVRQPAIEIADRFFSAEEVAALHAVPAHGQHERFFHYWTLKESYIKARGMGLAIPLDQFGFHFPGAAQVGITIHPQLNDDAARWRFWQLRPSADFLAALCVERTQPASPQLVMRNVVPLSAEDIIDYALLRTSG
jgi:4'-phosphopantetheinyl transferase